MLHNTLSKHFDLYVEVVEIFPSWKSLANSFEGVFKQ